MNNDSIRTFSAFTGAILGIINFVWNIICSIKIGFKCNFINGNESI